MYKDHHLSRMWARCVQVLESLHDQGRDSWSNRCLSRTRLLGIILRSCSFPVDVKAACGSCKLLNSDKQVVRPRKMPNDQPWFAQLGKPLAWILQLSKYQTDDLNPRWSECKSRIKREAWQKMSFTYCQWRFLWSVAPKGTNGPQKRKQANTLRRSIFGHIEHALWIQGASRPGTSDLWLWWNALA